MKSIFQKLTENKINNYTIPEFIQRNSILTPNIKDIANWQTKVILGNSGQKPVGSYDKINYLMISPDGIMIPIAKNDEHHSGYDLLQHYYKQGLLTTPNNFVHILPLTDSYVYLGYEPTKEYETDLKNYVKAFDLWNKNTNWNIGIKEASWRKWGQPLNEDGSIDYFSPATKGSFDFVKEFTGLNIQQAQQYAKTLTPTVKSDSPLNSKGAKVVELIEGIWIDSQKHNNKQLFRKLYKLLEITKPFIQSLYHEQWEDETARAFTKDDENHAINIVFRFSGIKNYIHNMIRRKDDKIGKLFGNLDVAFQEFERLGSLK